MMIPPTADSIDIHVPDTETEQTFLLLVVAEAVKQYRERHHADRLSARPHEAQPGPRPPSPA